MSTQKTPDLIKLYIKSCAIGFVLAAIFVGAILWLDVAGIGGLVMRSDIGVMATLVFWILNGIVFAGVQFAIAIMLMGENGDDDDDHKGRMIPVFGAERTPVRVTAPQQKRR